MIENTFGILSVVVRVLRKPMLLNPNAVRRIVITCVYLHNFLRKDSSAASPYTPTGTFDTEDNDGQLTDG
jgi:hypothetical protein